MVAKKGFTEQASKLAKHESIGCLSLLPADPKQVGFSIGEMWYGVVCLWSDIRLIIHFAAAPAPMATCDANTVKLNGKPAINWFLRELFTTHAEEIKEGTYTLELKFDSPRNIEVEGKEWPVVGITCVANRVYKKKRRWISWSGDALYDWHTGQITVPAKGMVVSSGIEPDLKKWPDYDGEIPLSGEESATGFLRAIIYKTQKWDNRKNSEVPDLGSL